MNEFDIRGNPNEGCMDTKALTPIQEVNLALAACKFGWFHIRLLIFNLAAAIAGYLVTSTGPYLLPNAECDLNMDLIQKGILIATPYFGMLCSSALAGFLSDTFGRKIFILSGFSGMYVVTTIGGCSQNYEFLVIAKFIEGILYASTYTATVTLTSEFCHDGVRDRVMLCQSSFIALSQVAIAAMSWGLLTQDWSLKLIDGYMVLNTWNFYIIIMSLWFLLSSILYSFIPESPKFLVTKHKYDEARKVLTAIYMENTRKAGDTFQFADLWKDKQPETVVTEQVQLKNLTNQLVAGFRNVKPLFQSPLLFYLILICIINMGVMCLYNILRLWFPQLSTVVEHYANRSQELCVMLDSYSKNLKLRSISTVTEKCVPAKSGQETYINSLIIGSVCFLPYCINGILVNRVGKKVLVTMAGLISMGLTLGIRWANSKVAIVTLFSLDAAVSQTMMSLLVTTGVEIFPTPTRSLATAMILMMGRLGTLVGNVTFPVLLKMGCVVPFFTLSGIMACVVIMSFFLPKRN